MPIAKTKALLPVVPAPQPKPKPPTKPAIQPPKRQNYVYCSNRMPDYLNDERLNTNLMNSFLGLTRSPAYCDWTLMKSALFTGLPTLVAPYNLPTGSKRQIADTQAKWRSRLRVCVPVLRGARYSGLLCFVVKPFCIANNFLSKVGSSF